MKDIMILLNPWWKTNNVQLELAKEFKRELFYEVQKSIKNKQIAAIYGLRRTGKSTIFFQLIEQFLKEKIASERILYFSFDQKTSEIKEVFSTYQELNNLNLEDGRYYIFLDEIQKLENWQNQIKIFYDRYPNIKFFISGSSNIPLIRKSSESLAGRIEFFKLEPLSFKEWIRINKIEFKEEKIDLYEKELINNLQWYLKTPFPEIATLKEDITIRKYLDDFIISRIISYDLKSEFQDVEIALLDNLKNLFFENPGMILNIDALARNLNRGKEILIKHINYLEQGLIIRILKNYRRGALSSTRKLKKVYPYSQSFYFSSDESKTIENAIICELNAKHYWRDGEKEIDMVIKDKPIEIKYKNNIQDEDINNLKYFMKKFKTKEGYLITKNTIKNLDLIKCIPVWKILIKKTLI